MANDIGWTGLAASLVLVAVAVGLSLWRKLSLERSILWASARALVQLLLVGVALNFVLRRELAWSWAWGIGMIFFAADTVRPRAPDVPHAFRLARGRGDRHELLRRRPRPPPRSRSSRRVPTRTDRLRRSRHRDPRRALRPRGLPARTQGGDPARPHDG